jgi:hypothetical protein
MTGDRETEEAHTKKDSNWMMSPPQPMEEHKEERGGH